MGGGERRMRGTRQTYAGGQSLTGSGKDDRGSHTTPLARPSSSWAGGIAMAAEEAAVSEDEELQGAVWGDWRSQGSRKG